jgi:hypothetical protein
MVIHSYKSRRYPKVFLKNYSSPKTKGAIEKNRSLSADNQTKERIKRRGNKSFYTAIGQTITSLHFEKALWRYFDVIMIFL